MLAPQPRRPVSRSSIATTYVDSSPPSSWSDHMAPSTRTSVTSGRGWSEDGTEVAAYQSKQDESVEEDEGDEPPLIDFGDDEGFRKQSGKQPQVPTETPGDKLRMLLRQMEMEVRDSTSRPVERRPSPKLDVPLSSWRNGRRQGVMRGQDHEGGPSSPRGGREPDQTEEEDEKEEDSPPTPPPRITNPYLSRRPGTTQSSASPNNSSRMSSRAAVLQNSTSSSSRRSPSPPPAPSTRTPLQTFIASHPAQPTYRIPSDPSSSRSIDRRSVSSTSSSRKGKERATVPLESPVQHDVSPRKRRLHTPRRFSVEVAPDDSVMFAQEAESLEVQGRIELDIEDSSGEPPWDSGTEDSGVEEDPPPPFNEDTSAERTLRRRERTQEAGDRSRSISASPQASNTRTIYPIAPVTPSRNRGGRDAEGFADIEEEPILPPRKQISPRTSPRKTFSQRHTMASSTYGVPIGPPEPLRVGLAHVSTPQRILPDAATLPTPHPPGRWYSPAKLKPFRGSPLRETIAADTSLPEISSPSVHRLRLSPAKAHLKRERVETIVEEEEAGNSSFLERIPGLSKIIAKRHPLPPPSTTLQDAKKALALAARTSNDARIQVESTQRQWLDAMATAQALGSSAIVVARKSWTWSSWAWWVCVEMLLLWGVFRVTLDYASSARYVSMLDPFSLHASGGSTGLSVPLPTAISAFIIPHRGSANFFDLLERADVWKRLEDLGILAATDGGQQLRMFGVPT